MATQIHKSVAESQIQVLYLQDWHLKGPAEFSINWKPLCHWLDLQYDAC